MSPGPSISMFQALYICHFLTLSVLLDFLSQDEAYIAYCHLKDKCFDLFIVDVVVMFIAMEDVSSSVGNLVCVQKHHFHLTTDNCIR